jgi:hypothetical protein
MKPGKIVLVSFILYFLTGLAVSFGLYYFNLVDKIWLILAIGTGSGIFEWLVLYFGYMRAEMNYQIPGLTIYIYLILSLVIYLPAFVISIIIVRRNY